MIGVPGYAVTQRRCPILAGATSTIRTTRPALFVIVANLNFRIYEAFLLVLLHEAPLISLGRAHPVRGHRWHAWASVGEMHRRA